MKRPRQKRVNCLVETGFQERKQIKTKNQVKITENYSESTANFDLFPNFKERNQVKIMTGFTKF